MSVLNVKPELYERLARRAAAENKSVDEYVEPTLSKLAEVAEQDLSYDQWMAKFKEWMSNVERRSMQYPDGFIVKDDRESIYEGRGE